MLGLKLNHVSKKGRWWHKQAKHQQPEYSLSSAGILHQKGPSHSIIMKYLYDWSSHPSMKLRIPSKLGHALKISILACLTCFYNVGVSCIISISISNNFIVSQYTFSIIHMYTKRLHQHIHKQFSESIQCYGSKWSWKSCWIYGLLVWYTKYRLSQKGCKGAGGATVTTHFVSNMQHTAL